MFLTEEMKSRLRIPYALRRVPERSFNCLLPRPEPPQPGNIVLTRLEKIGKNARLELANGRPCTLHEGDLLACVFGHRYATQQFEGYARSNSDLCDLLSMGGLCGLVTSKHENVSEPSKLVLMGGLGDADSKPLRLRDFALAPLSVLAPPRIIVVCGSSMDAGKTHTAMSMVVGLRRCKQRVAAIKLTGTATGRDTWNLLDAGACPALDFVDGGLPSTYLCSLEELLHLYRLLVAHAVSQGADWVVIEIADGIFQTETAVLLQSPIFTQTVSAWLFAASEPLAAACGIDLLRRWGIEPVAISGLISQSPLAIREVQAATRIRCLSAREIQSGALQERLQGESGDVTAMPVRSTYPPSLVGANSNR